MGKRAPCGIRLRNSRRVFCVTCRNTHLYNIEEAGRGPPSKRQRILATQGPRRGSVPMARAIAGAVAWAAAVSFGQATASSR